MALLVEKRTQRGVLVEAELLIGRSSGCGLRIAEPYVSARHAVLRWDGERWEVKDLGSRNGTLLNGLRLSLGQGHRLTQGAEMAFGNEAEVWELQDASPPAVMAIPLDGGEPVLGEHGVLGIPSAADPQASVFRDLDLLWKLETAEGQLEVLEPQGTFRAGGRVWRFSCPDILGPTTLGAPEPERASLSLTFFVSSDEEQVELRAIQGLRVIELGCRNHNILLLRLARARREDTRNGILEPACGWLYQDELVGALKSSPSQLNIDVFRIRQHFAKSGIHDFAGIVERRSSTKQLRIGIAALEIETLSS